MKLRFIPYFLLQCSWGIIQTFVGFIVFCCSIRDRHSFFNGAIATCWKKPYGISLGAFIFIPPKARFYNSDKYHFSDDEIYAQIAFQEQFFSGVLIR